MASGERGADGLTYDESEIQKFYRRRTLDHISLAYFMVAMIPVLAIGLPSLGGACSDELEKIMVLFGFVLALQVVIRFLALYPHYACEAEEFPDSQIMMGVWLLSRAAEAAFWCCIALMPHVDEYALCSDTMRGLCMAISIAWPIYYGLSTLGMLWIQGGGSGGF